MAAVVRLTLLGVRRRGLGQVAALVLVTALASGAVVAGLASRRSTASIVDSAYRRLGRPDLVLYGAPDALRSAAKDPEVGAASPPSKLASVSTRVAGESVAVSVGALPATRPDVGGPDLVNGRWPLSDSEVVVERSVIVEGVTHVGGSMLLTGPYGAPAARVRVVGSVIEMSDCLYLRQQCDPLRFFGSPGLVAALTAAPGSSTYRASYRLVHADHVAAVGARLVRAAGAEQLSQNTWPDTRGDILVMGDVFGALLSGLGGFMLAAACFVIAGATAARLVARRRSLGLLRAIGFSPRQLTTTLLAEHLVIGGAGVALGCGVGALTAPGLSDLDKVFTTSASTLSPSSVLIAFALVEGFLTAAVIIPAWRSGREPASAVLRDAPPTPNGGRLVAAAARRLGAGPSLVAGLRRAVARPTRAALAAAALFVAALGAVVSLGLVHTVSAAEADTARVGDPFDAAVVTPNLAEATRVLSRMREVAAWQTERETTATLGDATYRANLVGGDPKTLGYRIQSGRGLAAPGDAIVGYGFLKATGRHVGDPLHLTLGGVAVDLRIVGWYSETADAGKVVQALESSLPVGAVVASQPQLDVRVAAGVSRDDLVRRLRAELGDGAVVIPNRLEDFGIVAIEGTLVGLTVLLGLVAAANLIATTVAATRERFRALGILRALGCTSGQLVAQSAAGTALLGLIAGLVGLPLGLLVFRVMSDSIAAGTGVGPGMPATPSAVVLAMIVPAATLIAAGCGAIAAAGPLRRPAAELVRYE